MTQHQNEGTFQPNIIVSGSGHFKTITEGINSYPKIYQGRYIIYVKAGIYDEYITVDHNKNNILLYGDGPYNTIITGRKNSQEGFAMPLTSTFTTFAENFIAKSIAFENTAGPEGEQAVALRVVGDHSAFFNCIIRGYQDTLYVDQGRQFYSHCVIYGTIDIIFGGSTTLIKKFKILVRKPIRNQDNVVVADRTDKSTSKTGIVLQNCSIMPDVELMPYLSTVKTYLARPWGSFSKAVFIQNYIDNFIQRDGYRIWGATDPRNENTFFAEFGNIGPGVDATTRVKWAKGLILMNEAFKFTAEPWIEASIWLPFTRNSLYFGFWF